MSKRARQIQTFWFCPIETPHAARIGGRHFVDWILISKQNCQLAMANSKCDDGGGGGGGGSSAEDDSVLRLRWNSHVESLQQLFESLLEQQLFVDVTLACEGGSLKAHRVMLSACSTYFRRVLHETASKNPVIIMRDVSQQEMDFILQFIYRGEIHVPEIQLPSLLKTARLLEIRGLSDNLDGSYGQTDSGKSGAGETRKRTISTTTTTTNGFHSLPINGNAKKSNPIVTQQLFFAIFKRFEMIHVGLL